MNLEDYVLQELPLLPVFYRHFPCFIGTDLNKKWSPGLFQVHVRVGLDQGVSEQHVTWGHLGPNFGPFLSEAKGERGSCLDVFHSSWSCVELSCWQGSATTPCRLWWLPGHICTTGRG